MRELSRREAIAAGLAGAVALAVAPAVSAAPKPDPGAALAALVRAEEDAIFVYLNAGLSEVGGRLAAQDGQHARALETHLEALGLPMPGPTRGRDALGPAARAVLAADGGRDRSRAAIAFEQSLIDGCAARLDQLEEAGIVRTVATVMAGHAQHQVLHARAAGEDPLSSEA